MQHIQHNIDKRKDTLDYTNLKSLSKDQMNDYFQQWCQKAESYPYFYYIIKNKLHYHILNGPTLIFPSKEYKIEIVNNKLFTEINDKIFNGEYGGINELIDYVSDKYCTFLSNESQNFYKKQLKDGMELCTICNKLYSRIRVCRDICFYNKKCLKRGALCHYYHVQDLEKKTALQAYIDINSIFMTEYSLWSKYPGGRIHFACLFIRYEKESESFLVKIMKELPEIIIKYKLHNVELINHNLYRFYLPSKKIAKDREFILLNYGMRRVIHHKLD
jgi:hypothetical protein